MWPIVAVSSQSGSGAESRPNMRIKTYRALGIWLRWGQMQTMPIHWSVEIAWKWNDTTCPTRLWINHYVCRDWHFVLNLMWLNSLVHYSTYNIASVLFYLIWRYPWNDHVHVYLLLVYLENMVGASNLRAVWMTNIENIDITEPTAFIRNIFQFLVL